MTNPAHLSGLVHLDNFIMTRHFRPSIGTVQKQIQPRRRRQQTIPPAVIKNTPRYEYIRLPALQVIKFFMTRHIFLFISLYLRHAIAQPNSFCRRAYKKLALAPLHFIKLRNHGQIIQFHKTCTATLGPGQFFMPALSLANDL